MRRRAPLVLLLAAAATLGGAACSILLGNDKDYALGTGGASTSSSSSVSSTASSSSSGLVSSSSSSSGGGSSSSTTSGSSSSGEPDAGHAGDAGDAGEDAATCDGGVLTDTHNCGACGHDCLGLPCTMGFCAKTTLATGFLDAHRMALDANNLYVTETNGMDRVVQIPLNGDPTTALATGQAKPYAVTVDATTVYWSDSAVAAGGFEVWSAPIDGGPVKSLFGGTGFANSWGIATYGGVVYFTDVSKGVYQIAPDGGATALVSQSAWGVTADASYVYWTETGQGAIYRQAHGAPGTQTQIAVPGPGTNPTDLVVTGGQLYWVNQIEPGQVMSAPAAPSTPLTSTLLVDNVPYPDALAVYGGYVYFATAGSGPSHANNDGTVQRVPIGGGPPLVLAQKLDYASAVVVDAQYVYWIDYGDGGVYRVAR